MSEVWYHLAQQTKDENTAALWMVGRDESGYTCRVWQLSPFDRRKVEAWMRMTELRKSKDLPLLPPPDISDMSPVEARFEKIHEARAYLGTAWDQALKWHASEFFRKIDPVRYPSARVEQK